MKRAIVCPSSIQIKGSHKEDGWSCLKVVGPLDFTLVGILADLTATLAKVNVPVFVRLSIRIIF